MLVYRTPAEIVGHDGLRIVLVRGVPSPWSQAAKTILEIKGLDYVAAPLDVGDEMPGVVVPQFGMRGRFTAAELIEDDDPVVLRIM